MFNLYRYIHIHKFSLVVLEVPFAEGVQDICKKGSRYAWVCENRCKSSVHLVLERQVNLAQLYQMKSPFLSNWTSLRNYLAIELTLFRTTKENKSSHPSVQLIVQG